jgi:hypothetical protein
LQNGEYICNVDTGVLKTTGNNKISIDYWIEVNNVEVLSSRGHLNITTQGESNASSITQLPLILNANDQVRVRVQRITGTQNGSLTTDSCRFNLIKVIA